MKTYSNPVRRDIYGQPSRYFYLRERCTVTGRRRWINTGASNLEAARERKRALEVSDAKGERPKHDSSFSDALDRWLELKQHRMTPRGHQAYKAAVAAWKRHYPKGLTVRAIDAQAAEKYFARRAPEVTPATLNKERRCQRQFFRWAFEHGLRDDPDPLRTVQKLVEEARAIRALSPEEQAKLIEACALPYKAKAEGHRNAGGIFGGKRTKKKSSWTQTKRPPTWLAPLVRLALATGLRYGNLEGLTWAHVDLKRRLIVIEAGSMKARREHSIPLDPETVALLEELKRQAKSVTVLDLPGRRVVTRAFECAVERAGIAPCRFHDLRATFISDCCRGGVPLEVAAALAGHADIQTTSKFYRKIQDSELREAMAKRAAAAAGAVKTLEPEERIG
jgi:integrase